ncbi:hypothetical protein CC79DRAFT_1327454 [Sarocladium strictum]
MPAITSVGSHHHHSQVPAHATPKRVPCLTSETKDPEVLTDHDRNIPIVVPSTSCRSPTPCLRSM